VQPALPCPCPGEPGVDRADKVDGVVHYPLVRTARGGEHMNGVGPHLTHKKPTCPLPRALVEEGATSSGQQFSPGQSAGIHQVISHLLPLRETRKVEEIVEAK
jgi:hypothetical protein